MLPNTFKEFLSENKVDYNDLIQWQEYVESTYNGTDTSAFVMSVTDAVFNSNITDTMSKIKSADDLFAEFNSSGITVEFTVAEKDKDKAIKLAKSKSKPTKLVTDKQNTECTIKMEFIPTSREKKILIAELKDRMNH